MSWEDKTKWITNCPICYASVTHQFYDYHLQYHETQTDAVRYYTELMKNEENGRLES